MFDQDDKVVYPGHGVAYIHRIIERRVAGISTQFYELKFVNKEMTILVPVNNVESIGIRQLSSQKDIGQMFKILAIPFHAPHHDMVPNWNKRNKEYQGKIRSGKLREICEIYRDLRHIEQHKELSFGEKNLLNQTETLLVEEISLVCNIAADAAAEQLRSIAQK